MKQLSDQQLRGVSEECVEFLDESGRIAINLVPFSEYFAVPRVGETVFLPGEDGQGKGDYTVKKVFYNYAQDRESDRPCPARLLKVSIFVTKPAGRKGRRSPGVLDPLEVYAIRGEAELKRDLEKLGVDALKDIVAEHGMDTSKLALKWKSSQRLIDLILRTVRERSTKGDAFRGN